jgi:hypothetical protein
MNPQKGIVLFTTILMLAMITVLILSLIQAVFLYAKASNHVADQHEIFYQLESTAHQLSTIILSGKNEACTVKGKNSDKIIELLKLHKGCQLETTLSPSPFDERQQVGVAVGREQLRQVNNHYLFEYLIDDLGAYPCLQIDLNHRLNSSHHYLLTVAIHQSSRLEWIQLRIAKGIDPLHCDEETKLIHEGILSWIHQTRMIAAII